LAAAAALQIGVVAFAQVVAFRAMPQCRGNRRVASGTARGGRVVARHDGGTVSDD
jgi:hypothetical protein